MNHGIPGAAVAQPWDSGTGLCGYVWHAAPPRAIVLLQHGFAEYAERYVAQYSGLIPGLVAAGLTVYAIDLEGHGRSSGRRAVTDACLAVQQHRQARRTLRTQPLPVFLFGHSLGGLITASSAAVDADGVAGVILSGAALLPNRAAIVRRLAQLLATVVPAFPAVRLPPAGMTRSSAIVALADRDPLMYRGAMPAKLGASMLAVAHEAWPRYRNWRLPVLVIHGTADTYTEPEGSRLFVETIPATDKTLHLVEAGFHETLNDPGGDRVRRLILDWLDARIPAATP